MADTAALVYDIDSKSVRTAASDLAKLNDASARAAGGANSLNKTLRDSQGRFRSSYDVAKQYGDEIRGLAAKYNPALNAVYQYQNAQLELNRAVALGVLSQQQADAALERTAAQIRATANASLQMANAQKANGAQTANVFSQLNDIGVMLAAGQNPFQLALQQGTQLNQVWVSMGKEGRTLGGVFGMLKSAVASMLSPMSLLTIGTIAGTAALVNWLTASDGASSSADKLNDAISNLEGSAGRINSAYRLMAQDGLEEVYQAYGRINDGVIRNIQLLTEAAVLQELQAIKDAAAAIKAEFTGGWITSDVDDIRSLFNTTNDNARSLLNTLDQIKNAKTFDEQAAAAVKLRDALLSGGRSIESFEGEARRAVIEIVKMADGAERLKEQVDRSKKLGEQFASLDLAGGVIAAGNAALVLAQNMGIALATAQRLAALGDQGVSTDPSGKRYSGRGGDPREMGGSTYDLAVKEADAWIKVQEEIEKTRKKAGGGGGKAAAELKAAEKQFQSLRELLEKESLFQVAEYEKRQAQLQNALDKRLITEQQYNELRTQLQIFYFGTEYERNALQYQMDLEQLNLHHQNKLILDEQYYAQRAALQWQYTNQSLDLDSTALGAHLNGLSQYFGNANSLAGGGYEKLLKLQKTFAAASAFVSAYQGASMALTDPTLTTWQRIAAAGKVLATGLGFVNAIKGSGNGGGGGRGAAASATAVAKQEPTRYVEVSVQGDSWAVGLVENVMDQIYEQTKNGRVIIGGAQ